MANKVTTTFFLLLVIAQQDLNLDRRVQRPLDSQRHHQSLNWKTFYLRVQSFVNCLCKVSTLSKNILFRFPPIWNWFHRNLFFSAFGSECWLAEWRWCKKIISVKNRKIKSIAAKIRFFYILTTEPTVIGINCWRTKTWKGKLDLQKSFCYIYF